MFILPAVAKSAERAGVVRVDDHHKPGKCEICLYNAVCQDICTG